MYIRAREPPSCLHGALPGYTILFMNIFILDTNPVVAAQMQCDKHVVKMVLESAQILSTIAGGPYRPTHSSHPCVLWAKANATNYNWLVRHALALCAEYTARYGKRHKSQAVIEHCAPHSTQLPIGVTPFVQCMPEQYRHADPVIAYRQYYHSKQFAVWAYTQPPYWWNNL